MIIIIICREIQSISTYFVPESFYDYYALPEIAIMFIQSM